MSALPFALRLTCRSCCWLACFVIIVRPVFTVTSPIRDLTSVKVIKDSDVFAHRPKDNRDDNDNRQRRQRRDDGKISSRLVSGARAGGGNDGVYEDADVDLSYDGDEDEDYPDSNITEKGRYLDSPCEDTCHPDLQHVVCESVSGLCECEKLYPVRLGNRKGCVKPKKLGEQCFYQASCTFVDQHSTCAQVQHNAVCDCIAGYHRVALSRPSKKIFCAEDLVLITADIPTLLGIASGLAVFTGLICFVLKLFSRARYTRPRHYANANHAPPMLFSSDTGIPLTLHGGRPSSRSSQRSESDGPLSCAAFGRRPSSGGSRGPLVPASRAGAARAAAILLISCHLQAATKGGNKHRRTLSDVAEGSSDGLGSRRPSLASVHSSTSSARSYSARRLERERNDKEQRQALQELRLARSREQQEIAQQIVAPTPSPRTPHSTDELLPSVEEGKEVFYNEQVATTSIASEIPGTSSSSSSLTKRVSASIESSTIPKKISSMTNETLTMVKKNSMTNAETSLTMSLKRGSNSNEISSVLGTRMRTTISNENSPTPKRTSMSNETAFTGPSACTSAFAKELSSNCSSSIDIFES